ncbi:MAG: 23S rRNA (adenine(2030)-N(6))-methyltransferase RlmJ [Methylococcaceae bacterium]
MLSYRHGFHAGNHADVLKHVVLSLIVHALCAKDKPFFYLDTHSGAGRYDLESAVAQKNREYESGISRLLAHKPVHPVWEHYLAAVRAMNSGARLKIYPGSPRLVRQLIRPGDRMSLCERHPTEVNYLREEFAHDGAVRVFDMDGYQALKTLLPPPERRGLVLIDPAYESRDEWSCLLEGLRDGYRRWPTGTMVIWYPVQDRLQADERLRKIKRLGIPKTLMIELSVMAQEVETRMIGSGLIVINPPWKLEEQMRCGLPDLWTAVSVRRQGGYRLDWLVSETAA